MTTVIVLIALWLTGWALCELYTNSVDRASRARTHVLLERAAHPRAILEQANPPQPVPEYNYDPESLYDSVLITLSQRIRGDFMSPQQEGLPGPSKSNNTHTVDGPAGPS